MAVCFYRIRESVWGRACGNCTSAQNTICQCQVIRKDIRGLDGFTMSRENSIKQAFQSHQLQLCAIPAGMHLIHFCQRFLGLQDEYSLGLLVESGGSPSSGFQNLGQLFVCRHSSVKFPDGFSAGNDFCKFYIPVRLLLLFSIEVMLILHFPDMDVNPK